MKLFKLITASLISVIEIQACTGIMLKSKDGSVVHGRTLEFGTEIVTSIAIIPRKYSFQGTIPKGKGMAYEARYGVVGVSAFNEIAILDGVNEKGLSVGTFYFPGYASYAEINSENQMRALSPTEFPNWILTQFATIDEVKAALSNVFIAPTVVKAWGKIPPPFHYIVYDRTGKSLVIEPLDGKLVTFDNPLGVFTNSPTFDWHLTNLRNFINLSAMNAAPIRIDGILLAPFGQGSGMWGLPGDFTPPSRFVRATIFSSKAIPSSRAEESILQVFHILNQFDIPKGVAREVVKNDVYSDYTMMTCARDPQSLKFYFRSYQDQTIRMVDLNQLDLNAKNVKMMKATGNQLIIDMSDELK